MLHYLVNYLELKFKYQIRLYYIISLDLFYINL